jgi:RHS repeat-associated protein
LRTHAGEFWGDQLRVISGGNQLSSDAPLSRNTTNLYDPLNRLKQITDPAAGVTKLGYDANDQLTSVIDPRMLTTTYTRNGFGDLSKQISPDTGTTINAYDSGGNLKTATDARGALATYSYDALNRATQVAHSDQTILYSYDAGTNGKGRLTSAADASHSMSWAYDTLGRVTNKGQTVSSITKSVGYAYTNGDLITLTTPSGQVITYGYTDHRITSVKANATTILSGVTYDPFGPANAWTWGNATTVSRTFDSDSNPVHIITEGVTNTYAVDNASRITGISDSGLASNSYTFGYDLLDRVTSGISTATTRGYTYDANSNRLTNTGTAASTEHVDSINNRLDSTSGAIARTYSYDTAGDTEGYANNLYTFNQRGRMSVATVSGSATNYVYNALGQLIEKSGNGGTTLLVYDEAGHLLGEYQGSGALVQETIWMGDTPVATLRPSGSTVAIYYVHTDHLGTPRKITRPSDNGLMWRWDPDTFGSTAQNWNPAGLGVFAYNLRFPGQYYLAESGLHYNYFRDYDPQTGRYLESDPIGLTGGINTYGYVAANPLHIADPLGLWIPLIHNRMSQAGAKQAGCSNKASEFGAATAAVDGLPRSQLPENSYWHHMRDGVAHQTVADAQDLYDKRVASSSSSCKIRELANALHDVQDSFSPAHENFQEWKGFSHTSLLALAVHGLKDAFPNPSTYGAAVQASADIIAQAAANCPCLCQQ